jgi:hypothetical protein
MKNRILISFLFLSVMFVASTQYLFAVDKDATFNVQNGDMLSIELQQGNITASTWDKTEVKVHIENINSDEVNDLTMEQKSGKIEIKFRGEDSDNLKIKLTIPSGLVLDFSTGGGNIIVENDLTNKVDFATGGGNISLKNVFGAADITTGGGSITLEDVGSDADITTAGGDIRVGTVKGKADISTAGGNINVVSVTSSADISTAGGNINVGSINGNANVSTAGGNVIVGSVSGKADISTAGGNIELAGATGKVEANSGAGNINLKNIKGSIEANTGSGSVVVELIPDGKNKSELNAGVGDITLYVPESSKATIIATTSDFHWGDSEKGSDTIKSDFESSNVSQNRKGNKFESIYKLNGGGSEIELNVGMGDINIKKLK